MTGLTVSLRLAAPATRASPHTLTNGPAGVSDPLDAETIVDTPCASLTITRPGTSSMVRGKRGRALPTCWHRELLAPALHPRSHHPTLGQQPHVLAEMARRQPVMGAIHIGMIDYRSTRSTPGYVTALGADGAEWQRSSSEPLTN